MTPELYALTLAALLQVAQFFLMAVPTNLELSSRGTLSPRDTGTPGASIRDRVSARTGRLIRAWDNHFESLAIFTIACVVISLSGQSTGWTALLAWIYLVARVLYVPAYFFGLVPWRSLLWFTGFLAATLLLISALV